MGFWPRSLGVCCAVSLLTSPGCAYYRTLRHAEFKARHSHIRSFAVLPPKVEVFKVSFKGDKEMLYDALPSLRQQAIDEVEQALRKRGYRVQPLNLSDEVLTDRPELKSSLYTIQQLFEKHMEEHAKRWFPRFQYSVGPEINLFADLADSDAIVLVRCQGIKKTGGEIAGDWLKTILLATATLGSLVVIYYPSITIVQIAVIDGNTGDLLWYRDNFQHEGFDIAKEKKFRGLIRGMMSGFPKVLPAAARSSRSASLSTPSAPAEAPPMTATVPTTR